MHSRLTGVVVNGFFRTGTTFIFSCLRQISRFQCFYEPYHPEILGFVNGIRGGDKAPDKRALGHSVEGSYFAEYEGIDIDQMQRLLSAERRTRNHPMLLAGMEQPHLKAYLDFLAAFARSRDRLPALQPNRFSFCLPWLRRAYPDYLLVLVTRHPRLVFASLQHLARRQGLLITPTTKGQEFWNVSETFNALVMAYGLQSTDVWHFTYYQQLYYVVRFAELVMAESADLVISHEDFTQRPTALLRAMVQPFGMSAQPAEAYATKYCRAVDGEALHSDSFLELEIAPRRQLRRFLDERESELGAHGSSAGRAPRSDESRYAWPASPRE